MQNISYLFEGVEDPRTSNATRHDLNDMLIIGLMTIICGGEGCTDMAVFGREKEDFLRQFLKLDHGIPSHDAFSDLFRIIDPKGLQIALLRLVGGWQEYFGDDVIAIDGKALRRSFAEASKRSPLHLVQAFATQTGVVLGQVRVADKSNEITALPALLELLSIAGRTVTLDAMHTQRSTAETILAQNGHYVLALKGNQGTLNEDVRLYMEDPPLGADITVSDDVVEKGHGRIETRRARVSTDIEWVQERHDWPGLKAFGAVEAERYIKGKTTSETRYFLMSETLSPEQLLTKVRLHWGIENSLHWVLDVTMNEDQQRTRAGHGAENMALMRRMAINMVRVVPEKKKTSMRSKLKRAGWNNNYLLEILIGAKVQLNEDEKVQKR